MGHGDVYKRQDLYWGTLITTLAGSAARIKKIKGSSSYNVEDYGIALAKGHGAGLTLQAFEKEIGNYNHLSSEEIQALVEKGAYIPSYMWNQNGWLCSRLGLTPDVYKRQWYRGSRPVPRKSIWRSAALGGAFPRGLSCGACATAAGSVPFC